jgi:hypothetical protein
VPVKDVVPVEVLVPVEDVAATTPPAEQAAISRQASRGSALLRADSWSMPERSTACPWVFAPVAPAVRWRGALLGTLPSVPMPGALAARSQWYHGLITRSFDTAIGTPTSWKVPPSPLTKLLISPA